MQGKQGNLTVVEDGMFESILRGKGYAGADESWDSVTAEDD